MLHGIVSPCWRYVWIFANLGENKITKIGCKWLAKCNWKQLTVIYLCKVEIMQTVIKSVGKDVNICVTVIGLK